MTTTVEVAPQSDLQTGQQPELVASRTGEVIRSGAFLVTEMAHRLADKLDARAQAKADRKAGAATRSAQQADNEAPVEVQTITNEGFRDRMQDNTNQMLGFARSNLEPKSPAEELKDTIFDIGREKEGGHESEARQLLGKIGRGAMSALRTTGEFTVGAGIVVGRAAQENGQKIAERTRMGADELLTKARETGSEMKADLQEAAESVKNDVTEALIQAKNSAEARKQKRIEARAERKKDRQERRENNRLEREADRIFLAAEAQKRRQARREKWAARKESFIAAIQAAETAVVDTYETAQEAVVDTAKLAVNRGREGYEATKRGAERVKSHIDDTRAVGAAALEAARATNKSLADQRKIGQ